MKKWNQLWVSKTTGVFKTLTKVNEESTKAFSLVLWHRHDA
jgi:hypothetical protein